MINTIVVSWFAERLPTRVASKVVVAARSSRGDADPAENEPLSGSANGPLPVDMARSSACFVPAVAGTNSTRTSHEAPCATKPPAVQPTRLAR